MITRREQLNYFLLKICFILIICLYFWTLNEWKTFIKELSQLSLFSFPTEQKNTQCYDISKSKIIYSIKLDIQICYEKRL